MSTGVTGKMAGFKAQAVLRPRAQVESQLKEAILSGQFGQGDKLPPETVLAEQFGVSRPTVREALSGLVSSGLIRKIPGVAGGSFVNSVTPDSLSHQLTESMDTILKLGALGLGELNQVRNVLEVPAARWAAEYRTDDHLDQLRDVVEKQRTTTIDDPDIPDYDLAFHSTVGQASGNRLLSSFIDAVHETAHPVQFLRVTPEVGRETVKQHMGILKALEKGDREGAAKAMDAHLQYVCRFSESTED